MRSSLRPLLALALLHAAPAAAQVAGRVVDPGGVPLADAAVELWNEQRQLAAARTGADGSFSFSREHSAGATALAAHRLGYGAAHQRVAPPATGLRVGLTARPLALDGMVVTAIPKPCPNREEPEARALWSALYRRYAHDRDTLSMSVYAMLATGTGPLREVTTGELDGRARWWSGVPSATRRQGIHETSPYPYAYPYYFDARPAFARWAYRELHGTESAHFIEESFGGRHTLSILARREGETVVAFCPRGRDGWKGATVEGTLTIRGDTSLAQVSWTFRTPPPRENAGGEVVFVPRSSGRSPLLPATGYYWRQLLGRRPSYYQEWRRYHLFHFLPADSLPQRPEGWMKPDRAAPGRL
jgi:hypothetical protein